MEISEENQECPICFKEFSHSEIQPHVNKCLFLSSSNSNEYELNCRKRKRSSSPDLTNKHSNIATLNIINHSQHSIAKASPNSVDLNFNFKIPLTQQLQPKTLDEFFGQNHILTKNTFLRLMLDENEIPNIILWGPPGCGKTSLANIISNICNRNVQQYKYINISAVNSGVTEIRAIINNVKREIHLERRTVVFIDEIHKFNKKQQNLLINPLTRGEIILIGATTENPSFALKSTLLNHCKVIVMEKLESSFIISIIEKALDALNVHIIDDTNTLCNMWLTKGLRIHRSSIKWLADTSDGDARIALNNLQLVLQYNKEEIITVSQIKNQIKKSHLLYDRGGEEHHNIISAMHESIKFYNETATLYWTTRMLMGGEDPLFIARRLVKAASEDIGNNDSKALQLAISTMQACQLFEPPESDILLSQCAIYLARAPRDQQLKSALALAKEMIKTENHQQNVEVPLHLRNIPPKLMAVLIDTNDNTQGSKQSYMPKGYEDVNFF